MMCKGSRSANRLPPTFVWKGTSADGMWDGNARESDPARPEEPLTEGSAPAAGLAQVTQQQPVRHAQKDASFCKRTILMAIFVSRQKKTTI